MRPVDRLRHETVEFVPERLAPGVLYVSRRFSTASHLCCCGCGLEVVTPLNPARWRVNEIGGGVSLHPSVGNWSFDCRSHYWIEGGSVLWAGAMSPELVARVRAGDRRDCEVLTSATLGLFGRFGRRFATTWARSTNRMRRWWTG